LMDLYWHGVVVKQI